MPGSSGRWRNAGQRRPGGDSCSRGSALKGRYFDHHGRLIAVEFQRPGVAGKCLLGVTSRLADLTAGDQRPGIIRINRQCRSELLFRCSEISLFLTEAGNLDMGFRAVRISNGPLLQLINGFAGPAGFDEQHGEAPLAGGMVGSPGQAEVIILLSSFEITRPAEEFRLLVIGGSEVVKAVRVSRLLVEGSLKGVDRPEIVPLLVKPHTLAGIISGQPMAADG